METIEQQVRELFCWLCQTPHPSGEEAALRERIADRLRGLVQNNSLSRRQGYCM